MHTVSRLSPRRRYIRQHTILFGTLSPPYSMGHRARCSSSGAGGGNAKEEDGQRATCGSEASTRLSAGLVPDRNCTRSQRNSQSRNRFVRRILYHTPSWHRYSLRAACYYHMAQSLLVCIHEQRSEARISVPRSSYAAFARDLQVLSLSTEHHFEELVILLVGTDSCLPACLPSYS